MPIWPERRCPMPADASTGGEGDAEDAGMADFDLQSARRGLVDKTYCGSSDSGRNGGKRPACGIFEKWMK